MKMNVFNGNMAAMDAPPVPLPVALLPQAPTALDPARNPVVGYLARLGKSSRRTMGGALDTIARLLSGADATAARTPWHLLLPSHTGAVRSVVVDRYSPATANRMLSALKGVLKECWRLGLLDAETLERLRDLPPARGSRLAAGRHVGDAELSELFVACGASTRGLRDAALLALAFGGGLRRSEIVAVMLADVDLAEGGVRVIGKGNRERQVFLASGGTGALEAWLAVRGKEPGPLLHPVRKGGQIMRRMMSAQGVHDALRALARTAGVERLSPHDARRSWVGNLLDAGCDLATAQKLAGHASPNVTARYDRRPEAAKKRAALLLRLPYRIRTAT
jgi:integrase